MNTKPLYIFNTLTKTKELFEPLDPPNVKIYVCGPTVYDFVHVGNFRGVIFFNLVRNWLTHLGYHVECALNYTDVDDKIIHKSQVEKKDPQETAETFIQEYEKDLAALGLHPWTHHPRVTQYMTEIYGLIHQLIDKKMAYVKQGEVFYSIVDFKGYGKLSHRRPEELLTGVRMDADEKKNNPLDFTLWKPSKPGEPFWESPWGPGRPGWHIECSAMVKALFGEQIDIHGGGMDLVFPHHENEIAQSEGVSGKPFAKYWMHNNMLNFGGAKMSKSVGNLITARKFMEQYHPEILKYMMLSVHYRSELDFSKSTIEKAIRELSKIYSSLSMARTWDLDSTESIQPFVSEIQESIAEALNQDFSTPEVFSKIFDLVRWFNGQVKQRNPETGKMNPKFEQISRAFIQTIRGVGKWMSLFQQDADEFLKYLDAQLMDQMNLKREDIEILVQERKIARSNKDYRKSDEIRQNLLNVGIVVCDTPSGTFWEVKK